MTSQPNAIHLAASALQGGFWSEYVAKIKVAYGEREEEIWELLSQEHPTTVNVIEVLSAISGQESLTACRWLLPVVGRLSNLSLDDAKRLLSFASTLDIGHRYMSAEQLKPHVAARPELGRELGEYLRAEGTSGDAALFVWAGAFAVGAPRAAACYLENLLKGSDFDTRLAAILSTFLPVDDEEVQRILLSLEPSLANAIVGNTAALGSVAWAALCHISGQSIRATDALQNAMHSGSSEAIIEIANSLYRVDSDTTSVTGVPVEELVSKLLQIGLADEHVRPVIDAAVDSLFFRKMLRPMATQSVTSLGDAANDVVALFPEVFGALANHHHEFASVLTNWLLSQKTSFASLSSLLSMCANNRAPVALDGATFAAHTPERRVKAARRLLALTHNGPTLCQFCALIAQMPLLGSERFNLSAQMLNKAFSEYPGATEEFLKYQTSTLSSGAPELEVFQGVYANVLEWRGVLEGLPKRNELTPNDSELEVLRAQKRRINREIMRIAAEQSIFANLFTKMHLAQGRKFASHTPFGEPQIAHMAESSHFVELPSSELADPMRGQIERSHFLRNAR
jgi:hypothetical protein